MWDTSPKSKDSSTTFSENHPANWKITCKVFPGDECCIKKQINQCKTKILFGNRVLAGGCITIVDISYLIK